MKRVVRKRVVCKATLADGAWGNYPAEETLRAALELTFPCHADTYVRPGPVLVSVECDEADDEALVAEVEVLTRYCHAEIIRDDIIETLLRRFRPEYESMVEVEVLDVVRQ